jgi:hypothetical protein
MLDLTKKEVIQSKLKAHVKEFEKEMLTILPKKECHSSLTLDQASLRVVNS